MMERIKRPAIASAEDECKQPLHQAKHYKWRLREKRE
jgi:hypothetical protein